MEEAVKIGKGNNGAKRSPPKKQQSTTRNTGKARGAAGERQKKVGGKGKSEEKLKAERWEEGKTKKSEKGRNGMGIRGWE